MVFFSKIRFPPLEKLKRVDVACSANTVLSPRFSPSGVSRGGEVGETCPSPVKRPLRNGERRLYSQAKKGSARGKGGPLSSSRKVLNLHRTNGYVWKFNERTYRVLQPLTFSMI